MGGKLFDGGLGPRAPAGLHIGLKFGLITVQCREHIARTAMFAVHDHHGSAILLHLLTKYEASGRAKAVELITQL